MRIFLKIAILTLFNLFFCQFSNSQSLTLSNSEVAQLKIISQNEENTELKIWLLNTKKRASYALKAQARPIKTIAAAGKLKGDPIRDSSIKSVKDFQKIFDLAITYKVFGGSEYLNKVVYFLNAWSNIYKTTGEPINETKLIPLIEAYDFVKNDLNDNEQIKIWLLSIANKELNEPVLSNKFQYNNFNSHRILIAGSIALSLNDSVLTRKVLKEFEKQLDNNLLKDGSTWDFHERDALHYHCYSIEPLLRLSLALKRSNYKDYYHYTTQSKGSLQKAVAFLIPFAKNKKIHHEYENSKVAFDKKRGDNNEALFKKGRLFAPSESIETLSLAAYFDENAYKVLLNIPKDSAKTLPWHYYMVKSKIISK